MRRAYLITALVPMLLSSCAGPAITQLDADIANANAAKTVACYNAQMQAAWKPDAFADAKDQALIIMAQALANASRPDPCAAIGGMSVYESRARIAEAQNKAAASVTSSVVTGGIAVSGIFAGADLLKTAVKNAGDQTSTVGDGNTRTSIETTANTDNHLSTRGDSSPVAAANPPVTGPDFSKTEIHEAAPEAPIEAVP